MVHLPLVHQGLKESKRRSRSIGNSSKQQMWETHKKKGCRLWEGSACSAPHPMRKGAHN